MFVACPQFLTAQVSHALISADSLVTVGRDKLLAVWTLQLASAKPAGGKAAGAAAAGAPAGAGGAPKLVMTNSYYLDSAPLHCAVLQHDVIVAMLTRDTGQSEIAACATASRSIVYAPPHTGTAAGITALVSCERLQMVAASTDNGTLLLWNARCEPVCHRCSLIVLPLCPISWMC